MPILKMAGSAVLRVKPVISPKTVSDSEWPRSRIYKKIFPATQNSPFGKNIGARNGPERSFHLLFVSSYSSAIFSFSTNYFSTPPGVCLNKKSPSHFTGENVWCGRWDLNPRTPTGQAPQACASKTLRSTGLFDLAWQHEPPTYKADSRKHQARSRKDPNLNDAPNWLSPIRQNPQHPDNV